MRYSLIIPIVLLPLFLYVALLIPLFSSVAGQQSSAAYENATMGITFRYPSSWHLYNYNNGVIISSQSLDYKQVIPIFNKNEITNVMFNPENQERPSNTLPPVIVQVYTKFTNKTSQSTASEITHAADSVWSGTGNLTNTVLVDSPAYSLLIHDVPNNINALLTWGIKPIMKPGFDSISKQYNVAYITEGFDYDIYKKDLDTILSSLKVTQSEDQLEEQYQTVSQATNEDKKALQLYETQVNQKINLIALQTAHNTKVDNEIVQKRICNETEAEMTYRGANLANTTGDQRDDFQMTYNYYKSKFDKECKNWQPSSNLTKVTVMDKLYPPPFRSNPIIEYAP